MVLASFQQPVREKDMDYGTDNSGAAFWKSSELENVFKEAEKIC